MPDPHKRKDKTLSSGLGCESVDADADGYAGMTRKALLTVFTTEGGRSTGLQRTYVSRDCPYFKVDLEFQAVGRPSRDEEGRVTLVEGDDDVIVRLSVPYLQFSVID